MNEEPFSPLAVINPFKTFDDAVRESNRLPFGLASYGFTRSAKTANAIAAEVETGMMTINHLGLALPEVPFGGVKRLPTIGAYRAGSAWRARAP
jgi:succinate-semialdehyde dehydrogenase/glutarate-semialdehyde dehydrogenase